MSHGPTIDDKDLLQIQIIQTDELTRFKATVNFCNTCEPLEFSDEIQSAVNFGENRSRNHVTKTWSMNKISNIRERMGMCRLCALVHSLIEVRFRERGQELHPDFDVYLERTKCHFIKGEIFIVVVQTEVKSWIKLNDAFRPTNVSSTDIIQASGPNQPPSSLTFESLLQVRHISNRLRDCDKNHGTHCHSVSSQADNAHIFLIDTLRHCIVFSDTKASYYTLSYRWGQTENAELTRHNLDVLLQPEGLLRIWDTIPRVVREAIEIVRQLDVYETRYLWVDALCIIQDDKEHKHAQISQMGTIYDRAAMTIVALSAPDADATLIDTKQHTEFTHQMLRTVEQEKHVQLVPDFTTSTRLVNQAERSDHVYRSRGWTFQEEKLSRRILYCTDSGMMFRCRILHGLRPWWDDEWEDNPWKPDWVGRTPDTFTKKVDAISGWVTLVTEYSKRKFTYPGDTLRGFSGISEMLQHPTSGQTPLNIVCGICLDWFPSSLLWRPQDLQQRQRHENSFPTWSWANFSGPVDFPHETNGIAKVNASAEAISKLIGATPIDPAVQNEANGSLDHRRIQIRNHCILLLASFTPPRDTTELVLKTPAGLDTFYMLHIEVKLQILKWSSLGVKLGKERSDQEYSLYKGGKRVGGADITRRALRLAGVDNVVLIPLFEGRFISFMIGRKVGKDIYERLGIGYAHPKSAVFREPWPVAEDGPNVVHLI